MKTVPGLFMLLALAACSSSGDAAKPAVAASPGAPGATVTLTDADRAAVETAVRSRLGQGSATFRTMIAQRDPGGMTTVCGYVNPGAGDTPFVGMLSEGSFIVTDLGGPTERTIAVQQACHSRGIYI